MLSSRALWRGFIGICVLCAVAAPGVKAEFAAQPDGWASSLATVSGPSIADWQLANAISMWIKPSGFAHLVFIFDESFGGGMLDDLQRGLAGAGDVVLASACRHDEWAWFVDDATLAGNRSAWKRIGYTESAPLFGAQLLARMRLSFDPPLPIEETVRLASEADPARPNGARPDGQPWETHSSDRPIVEHAQWLALGNGGDVRFASPESVQTASSRYAVLFGGAGTHLATWNQIERIYGFLTLDAGYLPEDIYVLIGGGPGTQHPDAKVAPEYLDGPGTRQALWEAIQAVSARMDESSDLLFWATDGGERTRTIRTLNQVVREPARTILRIALPSLPADPAPGSSPIFTLDASFLKDILVSSDNLATIHLYVSGLDAALCGTNLVLRVNGVPAACGRASEIVTWDEDPDVDCTEFVFWIWDETAFRLENTIDITWTGPAAVYGEYTVLGLSISSGMIAASPETPEAIAREAWVLPSGDLDLAIGVAATGPTIGVASWCDAELAIGPFFATSGTDLAWFPTLTVSEAFEVGFTRLWWTVSSDAVMTLSPWDFGSVGAWIAFEPPAWTFGDDPSFALNGGCGWGPRWAPADGLTHGAGASVDFEVVWSYALWGGSVDLSADTTFNSSLEWPGWTFAADWQLSCGVNADWPVFPGGAPVLEAEVVATLGVLPNLGAGVDARLAIAADTYVAYVELGIETEAGFRIEIGAEYRLGFGW